MHIFFTFTLVLLLWSTFIIFKTRNASWKSSFVSLEHTVSHLQALYSEVCDWHIWSNTWLQDTKTQTNRFAQLSLKEPHTDVHSSSHLPADMTTQLLYMSSRWRHWPPSLSHYSFNPAKLCNSFHFLVFMLSVKLGMINKNKKWQKSIFIKWTDAGLFGHSEL